jgi:hypothetical protein
LPLSHAKQNSFCFGIEGSAINANASAAKPEMLSINSAEKTNRRTPPEHRAAQYFVHVQSSGPRTHPSSAKISDNNNTVVVCAQNSNTETEILVKSLFSNLRPHKEANPNS